MIHVQSLFKDEINEGIKFADKILQVITADQKQ